MPIRPENIPTIYETATDIPLHIKEKLTEHEIPLSELDNSSLNHPDIDKYIRANAEESYRTRDEHTATLIDYLKNNPEKGNNFLLLSLLEQIKEKNNEARVPMEARRMSIIRHEYQHTEDIAHIDSKSFISAVEKMNDLDDIKAGLYPEVPHIYAHHMNYLMKQEMNYKQLYEL